MNVTCNVDQLRSPTQMELLKLKKKKKNTPIWIDHRFPAYCCNFKFSNLVTFSFTDHNSLNKVNFLELYIKRSLPCLVEIICFPKVNHHGLKRAKAL